MQPFEHGFESPITWRKTIGVPGESSLLVRSRLSPLIMATLALLCLSAVCPLTGPRYNHRPTLPSQLSRTALVLVLICLKGPDVRFTDISVFIPFCVHHASNLHDWVVTRKRHSPTVAFVLMAVMPDLVDRQVQHVGRECNAHAWDLHAKPPACASY